jgi:diketogulonate reductase-like aldo/keto reductase
MTIPTTTLPDGTPVPAFGIGTWRMGERPRQREAEVAAVRLALDLGVTLIDTAEMYGEGVAEEIVAEAVSGPGERDRLFLVSKVYPHNASREGVVAACERSLARLATDRIDLYLLHWPGSYPLAETVAGFERLVRDGKIRRWGVSNFDLDGMAEIWDLAGGAACATDQVLYNLARRGIEHDLLPACRARGMPVMAYSPLEQWRLKKRSVLDAIGRRHGASAFQVALAWTLRTDGVISIPKATDPGHLRENLAALDLRLTARDLAEIDAAFPPPTRPTPLAML